MWSYLEISPSFDGLSLLHLCLSHKSSSPAYLHLYFLSFSHPCSLSRPVIPGLVVCPFGRLRGTMGKRAVGRLCEHHACFFPQPASNAAEPWPQWVLTLKIGVEYNSGSQTLFRTGPSIGGKKNHPHPNYGQCPPFVCWSSRVRRPAATSQDKTSEKPILILFLFLLFVWFDPQVPLLTRRDQTLGISGGSLSLSFFHPLKLILLRFLNTCWWSLLSLCIIKWKSTWHSIHPWQLWD